MAKDTISCLSLDLGANLGWSKIQARLRPEITITVSDHGTVDLNKLTDNRMRLAYNNIYQRNRVKSMIYEETIIKLVNRLKYDCFITEDVFCHPNHISAFRALVLYMETLERVVNIEKQKRLFTIPPTLIKKHISDYGLADKAKVQEAILANKNIIIKNPEDMSEHEADSIACAWAFVHEFLVFSI